MQRWRMARTNQIWKLAATWHRRSKSPQETGQRPRDVSSDVLLPEPSEEFPDTLSRSPLRPARPHQPDRWLEYGSASDLPQARIFWSDAAGGRPCSGSAICPRLINPVVFDKAKPPAVWRTLTIEGAFGGRFAACTVIDRILSGQVCQLFGTLRAGMTVETRIRRRRCCLGVRAVLTTSTC
jgi:hypothetical protein